MRFQITLAALLFSSSVEASCGFGGCNSIEEFSASYVQALLQEDESELVNHFYDEKQLCFLDKFQLDASYTGYNVDEVKLLEGDELDHFLLTVTSEATKVALYYDLKKNNPGLSNQEIMRTVFDELLKPDLVRVEVPLPIMPTHSVRLSISGEKYHSGHPCFAYTSTSDLLYLVVTERGFKAVEPRCDISRAVGKQRIGTAPDNERGNRIFETLPVSQVEEFKEHLQKGRVSTIKFVAENLALSYADAKFLVNKKLCPLVP